MCGRYTLRAREHPALTPLAPLRDRYNIVPQTDVPVMDEHGNYVLKPWDFSPPWAQKPMHLINARSETLREKPSFRGVRRCVFLADGWYEWQRSTDRKTPWFHSMDGELMYFAGVYNDNSGCAIVTRQAHENIAHVHHRQPVLLDARAVESWIDGHDLFASAITRQVSCYPVSRAVNRPSTDDASLIAPVDIEDPPLDEGESGDLFGN